MKQALKTQDSDRWKEAMKRELQQLDDLQTMKPVEILCTVCRVFPS